MALELEGNGTRSSNGAGQVSGRHCSTKKPGPGGKLKPAPARFDTGGRGPGYCFDVKLALETTPIVQWRVVPAASLASLVSNRTCRGGGRQLKWRLFRNSCSGKCGTVLFFFSPAYRRNVFLEGVVLRPCGTKVQ